MNITTSPPPFIPFANYRFTLLDGAVVVAGLLEVIVFVLAILAAVDHVSNEGRGGRKKRGKEDQPQCGDTQEEVIRSPIEVTSPDIATAGEGFQSCAIYTAGGTTRAIPQYIQGNAEDHQDIDTTLDSSDTTEVFFGEYRIPSSNFVSKTHGHLCLSADGSTWPDIVSGNGDYEDDNVFVDQENSSLQETTVRLSTFMPTDDTSVTETRECILAQHVNHAFVPEDRESSIDSGRSSKHESELSGFRPNEQRLIDEVPSYQRHPVVQHVELSVDTGLPVTKEDMLPTTGQLRRNSSVYKSTVNNPPRSYYSDDRQSFTGASRTSSMNARSMARRVSQSYSQGSSSFRWVDMGVDFPHSNVEDEYEGREMCVDTGRTLSEEDLHNQAVKTDPIQYFGNSNSPRLKQSRIQSRPNMTDDGDTSSRIVDDYRHKERTERPYSATRPRMKEVVNGQNRYDHAMDGKYKGASNSYNNDNKSQQEQTKPVSSQNMILASPRQGGQIRAHAIINAASAPYENLPEVKISSSPRTNVVNAMLPPGDSVPSQVRNVENSNVRPYENIPQAYREFMNANAPPSSRPYENLPRTHDEVNNINAPTPQISLVHVGRGFGHQPSNLSVTHDTQDTMAFTAKPTADIPHKQSHVQSNAPVLRHYENLPKTRDGGQSKVSEFRPYENLPQIQGEISSHRHGSMPKEILHQVDSRFRVEEISSSGPYETLPTPRGRVGAPGVQDNSIKIINHDLKRNAGSERSSYRQALAGGFENKTNKKAKSISKSRKDKQSNTKTSQIATEGKHPEESTRNKQTESEVGKVSNIQIYENHIQVRQQTPGVSDSDIGQYVKLRQPESKKENHWTRASYQPRLTDGISETDTSIPVLGNVHKSNSFTFSPHSGQSHEMPRTEGIGMPLNSLLVVKGEQEIMV